MRLTAGARTHRVPAGVDARCRSLCESSIFPAQTGQRRDRVRFGDSRDNESRRDFMTSSRAIPWLLCVLLPAHALAGNYPMSAFSSSLRMPPELVDESSLLFQLPQQAGSNGTRIFAYNAGFSAYAPLGFYVPEFSPYYTDTPAMGVVGHTGAHGVFLLAQPSVRSTFGSTNNTKLQAGWGASWSWLRVGLAARHERQDSESSEVRSSPGPGGTTYDAEYGNSITAEVWEGAIGLGVGSENLDLDVSLDLSSEEYVAEQLAYAADTLATTFRTDDEPSPHLTARLRTQIGAETEIVVSGRWGKTDADLDGTAIGADTVVDFSVARSFENWSASIGAFFSAGQLDWLGVSATWEHLEVPEFDYSTIPGKKSLEHVACAFSLRQRLWRQLWAQAGTAFRYIEVTRELQDPRPGNRDFSESQKQTITGDFAWGASYSWKYVDIRTTVSDTFDINNLFVALDVIVHP